MKVINVLHPGLIQSIRNKRSSNIFVTFVIFVMLFGSCKSEEPYFMDLTLPLKEESEHFIFYYDHGLTLFDVAPMRLALEQNYGAIVDHFGTLEMPKIKIAIWSDRIAFDAAMNHRY